MTETEYGTLKDRAQAWIDYDIKNCNGTQLSMVMKLFEMVDSLDYALGECRYQRKMRGK